jgi:lipoate-protein ligase B
LLFSELAPVITRGRRTPTSDILSRLPGQTPVPVVEVERGGLATYHGPGQWVVFAVDRLERLVGDSRGVRKMVEALLASALEVGQAYRRTVWQGEGAELGAWSERGKFAAVGIQVRGGVVLHGLAVNGVRTAESFEGLRPCGLDRAVDFLLEEASEAEFLRLREALEASLSRRLWQNGKPG